MSENHPRDRTEPPAPEDAPESPPGAQALLDADLAALGAALDLDAEALEILASTGC